MAPSPDHELMGLASISALKYPANIDQFHSNPSLFALDDMPQSRGKQEVTEKPREAMILTFHPKTTPPRTVRASVSWCSPDSPGSVARIGLFGKSSKHPCLSPRPEGASVDTFSGRHSPSTSSHSSQSTSPTTPYHTAPDSTKSSTDPIDGVSKPRPRGSPQKQLLNFCKSLFHHDSQHAYTLFLRAYPEFKLTQPIDNLRQREYRRLGRSDEVYVDYMGASLYPESLIRSNSAFLRKTVLGNTHSISASSHQSAMRADEARSAVLAFFDAPETEYTVIFTPNATGAMRLVGEAFPFVEGSSFVLGMDSHNSINGIRQFALAKSARVAYVATTSNGGIDEPEAKRTLKTFGPQMLSPGPPCLFALTGQSNVTNSKSPLSLLTYASVLGYYTLLDAAALAPSSKISLRNTPADAMAISFYKMFGFPTGVGCLVAKKSFLRELKRPWFAGGTVNVVQVPGAGFTAAQEIHEQFEDGTINFTSLAAITRGLKLLSRYIDYLPLRLSALTHYLAESLTRMRHDVAGTPVARVLSRIPGRRPSAVGERSETGSTVSLVFLEPSGQLMPNSFVEYSSTRHKISLRTGCMCNPGGAAAILGVQGEMEKFYPGITREDYDNMFGGELGVVRLSLGLASNFHDVHRVLRFVKEVIACDAERKKIWPEWESQRHCHA